MFKTKYLIIILVTICLLLLAGISYVVWDNQNGSRILRTNSTTSSIGNTGVVSGIQDNQTSELQIAPDVSSSNLGQIQQNSSTPNSSSPGTNSNSSSSNNSAASILDPATFKQYDENKNGKAALYKDLLVGEGAELIAGKKAAVLYKVWLTDGTLVDASRPNESGQLQAFAFTVGSGEVISAWDTSLTGMKVGGVRFLVVPPAVGYGATAKENIPANSVLVFQVQLMAVQ